MNSNFKLISSSKAAKCLGIPEKTLETWRTRRMNIPFFKVKNESKVKNFYYLTHLYKFASDSKEKYNFDLIKIFESLCYAPSLTFPIASMTLILPKQRMNITFLDHETQNVITVKPQPPRVRMGSIKNIDFPMHMKYIFEIKMKEAAIYIKNQQYGLAKSSYNVAGGILNYVIDNLERLEDAKVIKPSTKRELRESKKD